MKKIINYEKDILFKTAIKEICSISLEHDFTVDDGYLRGEFIVSGEYKANELSVNKESFCHKLPLEYELDENVDLSTLSYDVENFEYNVKDDELSVYIDFGIRYEEKKKEIIIPEQESNGFFDDEALLSLEKPVELKEELPRINNDEQDFLLNNTKEEDTFIVYHVHIVREGETLETIAAKYNVTPDIIKKYNDVESLELKSKLIIPDSQDE